MKNKSIALTIFFIIGSIFLINLAFAEDIKITYKDSNLQLVNLSFDVGKPNEANPVSLVKGEGKISYNMNGNTLREYDNIGANGSFSFKDKKLKSAEFNVTKDGFYSFGNHNISIPAGSKVIFKDNKVTIQLPKDYTKSIVKPTKIPGSSEEDVKVEYRYKDGEEPSTLKISDNNKEYELKKIGSDKFQLNFDPKNDAFYVVGKFEMNSLKIGEFSKDDETYLFFDGNTHANVKGSYISFGDKKLIIGASTGDFSPTVQFLPGNKYVTISDDKKMLMIQAIGGEKGGQLTLENPDDKIFPKITATTGYNLFDGNKAIRYVDSFKDKYKGPILLTNNPLPITGKESVGLWVSTRDNSGNRIGDWDVIFDSSGSVKAGTASELETGGVSVRKGVVTSARVSFNSLSSEEQTKLGMLSPEKRRELVSKDINTIKEELKKVNTITSGNLTISPPVVNNSNKTPPNLTNPNSGIKIGDKVKDSDKVKLRNSLTNSGVILPGQYNMEGVYSQISTSDGRTVNGYVFTGKFFYNSNGNKEKVSQVALTNKELYVFRQSCSGNSCSGTWVKARNL